MFIWQQLCLLGVTAWLRWKNWNANRTYIVNYHAIKIVYAKGVTSPGGHCSFVCMVQNFTMTVHGPIILKIKGWSDRALLMLNIALCRQLLCQARSDIFYVHSLSSLIITVSKLLYLVKSLTCWNFQLHVLGYCHCLWNPKPNAVKQLTSCPNINLNLRQIYFGQHVIKQRITDEGSILDDEMVLTVDYITSLKPYLHKNRT